MCTHEPEESEGTGLPTSPFVWTAAPRPARARRALGGGGLLADPPPRARSTTSRALEPAPRLQHQRLAAHELHDVATRLAALGYAGIAIARRLPPQPSRGALDEARALRRHLDDLQMAVAVASGARFLLDPARTHWPTLLDDPPAAARRLDYLQRCLALAVALRAETFSFWSGTAPPGLSPDETLERLARGAAALLDAAAGSGVRVCFEPEPGMAVASLEDTGDFLLELGRAELWLMLDVGQGTSPTNCRRATRSSPSPGASAACSWTTAAAAGTSTSSSATGDRLQAVARA